MWIEEDDPNQPGIVYQWIYKDVVFGNGTFEVLSPVVINTTDFGRLISSQHVRLTSAGAEPIGNEPHEVTSEFLPQYDSAGRVIGLRRIGDEQTLETQASYDVYGQIARERALDGTITRNWYDDLGRLQAVYRGTHDKHPYWGTADPNEPQTWLDDMVLIE